jgi:hypothetical protein
VDARDKRGHDEKHGKAESLPHPVKLPGVNRSHNNNRFTITN